MKKRFKLAIVLLWAALSANSVHASPFSSVVVFGDSLSDGGASPSAVMSIYKFQGGHCDPLHPCPLYDQGHYSNGPIAAEYLANAILAGGANPGNFLNFAVSGSTSGIGNFGDNGSQTLSGSHGLPGMFQQIGAYLTSTGNQASASALYMVWGGGNDFLSGSSPISAAQNIANYVGLLASSGAQSILVPNIPDLSRTPFVQSLGVGGINAALSFTLAFNQALAADLSPLAALFPTTKIVQFDTFGFFNAIVQNPSAYGYSDVTSACVNLPTACNNPSAHLFWDDFHPTTTVHAQLAAAMASQVPLPGAFWLFLAGCLSFYQRRSHTA